MAKGQKVKGGAMAQFLTFKEFRAEIDQCAKKVEHGTIIDIERVMTLENRKVELLIKPRSAVWFINGEKEQARQDLRVLYQRHKAEFKALLEDIKHTTDTVSSAVNTILEALTVDEVPGMVIDRLAGREVQTSEELIIGKAEKAMFSLLTTVKTLRPDPSTKKKFEKMEFHQAMGEKTLIVSLNFRDMAVEWGKCSVQQNFEYNPSASIPNAEEALQLLANISLIQEKVDKIVFGLKRLLKE